MRILRAYQTWPAFARLGSRQLPDASAGRARRRPGGLVPDRGHSMGSFVSRSGWIVVPLGGEAPAVLRTTDHGRSWMALPSPFEPRELPEAIGFADEDHGLVLTTERRVFRTADGGDSWTVDALPAGFAPIAVDVER